VNRIEVLGTQPPSQAEDIVLAGGEVKCGRDHRFAVGVVLDDPNGTVVVADADFDVCVPSGCLREVSLPPFGGGPGEDLPSGLGSHLEGEFAAVRQANGQREIPHDAVDEEQSESQDSESQQEHRQADRQRE
jgi:hypothetical protein